MTAKVMMLLGFYPFAISTAAYSRLQRSVEYRWAQQNRIGARPGQQFIGIGSDEVALSGEILPHWNGGIHQVDLMRTQAALGKPLTLMEGHGGFYLGRWVIARIAETKSELCADGAPSLIEFELSLRHYGSDWPGLDGLRALSAASGALGALI